MDYEMDKSQRTVFVTGIGKKTSITDIEEHFSSQGNIESVNICSNNKGICYITYNSIESIQNAIHHLNHTYLRGIILSVKPYEKNKLKNTTNGTGVTTTIPRKPMIREGSNIDNNNSKNNQKQVSIVYSNSSLLVNEIVYPIPTGLYLMKLMYAIRDISHLNEYTKLISLITSPNMFGNAHSKELSESMACINGLQKIFIKKQINLDIYKQVSVFIIGDGIFPLTTLLFALFYQNSNFKFYSIDPILNFDTKDLNSNILSEKISIHPVLSQNFIIPTIETEALDSNYSSNFFNIIIACHSHAPLLEFYSRLSNNHSKCCVSLPCCGKTWSLLNENILIDVYDDYEIFSAKRTVYLYYSE